MPIRQYSYTAQSFFVCPNFILLGVKDVLQGMKKFGWTLVPKSPKTQSCICGVFSCRGKLLCVLVVVATLYPPNIWNLTWCELSKAELQNKCKLSTLLLAAM